MYKEGEMAMKGSSMRYRVILFAVGMCFSGFVFESTSAFGVPTVTLRARKHNDTIISGDPLLGDVKTVDNVSPGDTVEIDLFLSDWGDTGNGTVRGFQAKLDCETFIHDPSLDCYLLQIGWDAPLERQACLIKSQCSSGSSNSGDICCGDEDCIGGVCNPSQQCTDPNYPLCNECPIRDNPPKCTGYDYHPSRGAFGKLKFCSSGANIGDLCTTGTDCPGSTCVDNTNFLLYGISPLIYDVARNIPCNYSFGGGAFIGGIPDNNTLRYIGTVIFQAAAGAKGTFTVGIDTISGDSFIEDTDGFITKPILDPVIVKMVNPESCLGECSFVSSEPPNCAIDARYPWPPDDFATKLGWNSVEIELGATCDDSSVLTANDFDISFVGGAGFPNITGVTDLGNQTIRVTFTPAIRPQQWACIELLAGGPDAVLCIGALPGDANNDGTSNAGDVTSLIDDLNSPSLSDWQCDADRSGSCQPGDLIGVIDMLNGGGEFDRVQPNGYMGQTISSCPSQ